MIRQIVSLTFALCAAQTTVYAQGTVLTVNTASADVYKSPSTGSPVIGKVARGAVLDVTRELGSWVKVSWPDAQDGVGYVHISMGTVGQRTAEQPQRTADVAPAPRPAASTAAPSQTPAAPVVLRVPPRRPVRRPVPAPPAATTNYVRPPEHIFGVGGRVGGTALGFGGTARAWHHNRFGVEFEASRYVFDTSEATQRVTSLLFEPSVLYSLKDRVTDYWWMRPYIGSGFVLRHHTLRIASAEGKVAASEQRFGYKVFGGSELTFAGAPRFALSADIGYSWAPEPFMGVDVRGLGVAVSGHWYVR